MRGKAFWETVAGFVRPILPSLAGRLSRSRASSEKGGLPVIAGMKVWWISSRVVTGGLGCRGWFS